MALALVKDDPHDDPRYGFLNEAERLLLPAIHFVEIEMKDDHPFERAREVYSQACSHPISSLVFAGMYDNWRRWGASHEMILAACVILAGRSKPYSMHRATSKVITDFLQRPRR